MAAPDFTLFNEKFRNHVTDDLDVASLIETRFREGHLATLFQTDSRMTFPLACFWPDIGAPIANGRVQRFNLNVRAYSNVSYYEAGQVMAAIMARLDHEIIQPRIVVRPVTTPTQLFESDPRLYSVGLRYLIHWLQ